MLVDSSKLAHRLKLVRRIDAFDVRVIHLVRDGRAVALTYMDEQTYADASDPALRRGGRGAAASAGPQMPMSRAADKWRRSLRSAEFVLGVPRSSWLRLTYEELCQTPGAVLQRVFEFLGVDPHGAAADFRSAEHHVVGNGMRLDNVSSIRLDERWKSALSAQDLRTFESVAGAMNRRFGYP